MKIKVSLLVIMVVSGLALGFRSVAQENIDSVNSVMEGKWIWTACYGGFSGECLDNPGPGNQRSVIFSGTDTDSILYEVYRNDTLILSGITIFQYVVTEFINLWTIEEDVVHGATELSQPYYIIRKIDSISIEFDEPCIDCYYYEYERDDMATGIEVTGSKNNLFLYPNPATGKLFVRSDNIITELEIIDITGKVIFRTTNKTGSRTMDIDISHIESGAYFVRSVTGSKKHLSKFLKL